MLLIFFQVCLVGAFTIGEIYLKTGVFHITDTVRRGGRIAFNDLGRSVDSIGCRIGGYFPEFFFAFKNNIVNNPEKIGNSKRCSNGFSHSAAFGVYH